MADRNEQIGAFRAQKGDDGPLVTIVVYQDYTETTDQDSKAREWMAGLRSFELESGGMVNRIDDETFEIVATGERLKAPKCKF